MKHSSENVINSSERMPNLIETDDRKNIVKKSWLIC